MAINPGEPSLAEVFTAARVIDPESVDLVADIMAGFSMQALTALDATLREAAEPLPAVRVHQYPNHGTVLLPGVWVGFATTQPGEGLQPVQETNYYLEGRPKVAGLAVPLNYDTLGSATFFPHPYEKDGQELAPSWWQQWHSTGYAHHVGGQAIVRREIEDAAAIGTDILTTWISNEPPFNSPAIAFNDGGDQERIVLSAVTNIAQDSHFIAVGQGAVRSLTRAVMQAPPRGAEILDPLQDMMSTIADTLGVEL